MSDAPERPDLTAEDFYYDGPYLVFTAAFHRKRGYCCGSGCRHCPYDENGSPVPSKGDLLALKPSAEDEKNRRQNQ